MTPLAARLPWAAMTPRAVPAAAGVVISVARPPAVVTNQLAEGAEESSTVPAPIDILVITIKLLQSEVSALAANGNINAKLAGISTVPLVIFTILFIIPPIPLTGIPHLHGDVLLHAKRFATTGNPTDSQSSSTLRVHPTFVSAILPNGDA
jgi:hypothetical protein